MALIRVGLDKEFTTIQGAYNNAVNGDSLLIDEGIYSEHLYFVDKVVNLIGNTDYPFEGKVCIQPANTLRITAYPLQIHYLDPNPPITMYVEGITFSSAGVNEQHVIMLRQYIANQTSSLSLVFNKCILDATPDLYGTGFVVAQEISTGYAVSSLTFNNCQVIWSGDDEFMNSYTSLIPNKVLSKCIISSHPPTDIFGVFPDLCDGGIITSSDTTDPSNIFDGSISTYGGISDSPVGWVGYQFTEPQSVNQLKLRGSSAGYYGRGFTLTASTTGEFLGEEVTLIIDTSEIGPNWYSFSFASYEEFSYIRIYNTGHSQLWRLAELELRFIDNTINDYILVDNNNDFQYGPQYSSYVTAVVPSHCFSGTVTVDDIPVARDLKVFRRDNGVYLGASTSSAVTGEYSFESSFGGYHNIICVDDELSPDYNDLLMSKCIPKKLLNAYTPYDDAYEPKLMKSIIIDVKNNWSGANYISLRSVEFFLGDTLISLAVDDFEGYATSQYSNSYRPELAFITALSKIGGWDETSWITADNILNEQRLICVFTTPQLIDGIVINNGHSSGSYADRAAKETKIYYSTDEITDVTYGVPISNSILLFDATLPKHCALNVINEYKIPLYLDK